MLWNICETSGNFSHTFFPPSYFRLMKGTKILFIIGPRLCAGEFSVTVETMTVEDGK